MANFTKTQGQLMDWTLLDDTGGVPSLESAALDSGEGLDAAMVTTLHIDICHADTNDASMNTAECIIWGKSGITDEDWHELFRFQADGGQANGQVLAAASGSGQANPDRIEVAATANFQIPGDVYFLKDAGALAASCIVVNKDFVTDDYIECIDDLVNAYDTSDYVYDLVNQWSVQLPADLQAARATFHNPDGDATYACRVRYTMATDLV